MAEITMDTDWGAKGAQLSGQQVQDFIKGQFRSLIKAKEDLENRVTEIEENGGGSSESLKETVVISLSSDQGASDSALQGVSVLVEDITNEPVTLLNTTWQGTELSLQVNLATIYRVTVGSVDGYKTPEAAQYTAQAGNTRVINMNYQACTITVNIEGLENGATASATISYNGKSVIAGHGDSVKVPYGAEVSISIPTVDYHVAPSGMSFTATDTLKVVTFTYVASKVLVNVLSNQANDTTIASKKAALSWDGGSAEASNGDVVYIPADKTVTVTFPAVSGYKTPSAVTINNTNGGQATASGTYQTEKVTVTVTAEDSASVAGQKVTINGSVITLDSTGVATANVPFGTSYSVSVDTKSGYTSPSNQSFTANQASRAVSMIYETIKLGVFIQDKSGKLWTTDQWSTSNNANANAIAVLTNNVKVLVALTDSGGTKQMSNSYSSPIENYCTPISDQTTAKADYKGKENTANILKTVSSTSYAAGWANAFTFPDGTKGHLPSLGEFWEVYQNKAAVDAALSKCGGTAMNTSNYHWCSTYWGQDEDGWRECWMLLWSGGNVCSGYLNSLNYVRAFAAYAG